STPQPIIHQIKGTLQQSQRVFFQQPTHQTVPLQQPTTVFVQPTTKRVHFNQSTIQPISNPFQPQQTATLQSPQTRATIPEPKAAEIMADSRPPEARPRKEAKIKSDIPESYKKHVEMNQGDNKQETKQTQSDTKTKQPNFHEKGNTSYAEDDF